MNDYINDMYNNHVEVVKNNSVKINLPILKREEIKKSIRHMLMSKIKESHYISDRKSILKRWYTGWCGECALEILLGEKFVDFSVGDSKSYNVADLSSLGLNIGVKTVNKGDFPLLNVPSASTHQNPQVIIVKENESDFLIFGLADFKTVNNINNFKSSLVRSSGVLKRGKKSAFYRFDLLKPFNSLEDLKKLL